MRPPRSESARDWTFTLATPSTIRGRSSYPLPGTWERPGAFAEWFRPHVYEGSLGWWPDETTRMPLKARFRENTMRILALLLMAELVRDGQIDFDAP